MGQSHGQGNKGKGGKDDGDQGKGMRAQHWTELVYDLEDYWSSGSPSSSPPSSDEEPDHGVKGKKGKKGKGQGKCTCKCDWSRQRSATATWSSEGGHWRG